MTLRKSLLPRYVEVRSNGFRKTLESLLRSQYYSRVALIAMQEEKLQNLIQFAYMEVPYYRTMFQTRRLVPGDIRRLEDLQKLPVLTKRDINDLRRTIPPKKARTLTRSTSGSTGSPHTVVFDKRAALIESALFFRFLFSIGYEWGDPLLRIWGAPIVEPAPRHGLSRLTEYIRSVLSSKVWNARRFDSHKLDRDVIAAILRMLGNEPPHILRGYTSAIYCIALEVIKAGIETHVKAVTTTAEKLFDFQRTVIERAFDRRMYDQYGCGESNSLAFECQAHNGLHVAAEHVILELGDDHGDKATTGNGRVIITDLDNYAMPLIRYENGDLAEFSTNASCSCGRQSAVLRRIEGRIYELLNVPGDRRIHGGFFDDIYLKLGFSEKYLIDDLRIVQRDMYNYELEFVMDGKLSEADVLRLRDIYRQYLGNVNVEVKYLKDIPLGKSGKRMFVVPMHQ